MRLNQPKTFVKPVAPAEGGANWAAAAALTQPPKPVKPCGTSPVGKKASPAMAVCPRLAPCSGICFYCPEPGYLKADCANLKKVAKKSQTPQKTGT